MEWIPQFNWGFGFEREILLGRVGFPNGNLSAGEFQGLPNPRFIGGMQNIKVM